LERFDGFVAMQKVARTKVTALLQTLQVFIEDQQFCVSLSHQQHAQKTALFTVQAKLRSQAQIQSSNSFAAVAALITVMTVMTQVYRLACA